MDILHIPHPVERHRMHLLLASKLFLVCTLCPAQSRISTYHLTLSQVVRVINAGAGGILLAVTLVHMLSDNSGELDTAGTSIFKFFTGGRNDARTARSGHHPREKTLGSNSKYTGSG